MIWQDYYAQNEHYKDLQREAKAQLLVNEAHSEHDAGLIAWLRRSIVRYV